MPFILSNLRSFVSRQINRFIKWLIGTVVKIGLLFIALFSIGLLGVLLVHGLTHAPVVAGGGGAGEGMPVVEIPVKAPVEQPITLPRIKPPSIKLPQKRIVEPRRIRVPYTNENRPSGQAPCDCPYDRARDSSICGGRSAYVKPGGKEPACYVGETTARERWWNTPETAFVDRERTRK